MFTLQYSNQPVKFLKKLDFHIKKRLIDELEKLQVEPFPQDVERIISEKEKAFRVRRGSYRIQYHVYYDPPTLSVFKIEKRSRAYG